MRLFFSNEVRRRVPRAVRSGRQAVHIASQCVSCRPHHQRADECLLAFLLIFLHFFGCIAYCLMRKTILENQSKEVNTHDGQQEQSGKSQQAGKPQQSQQSEQQKQQKRTETINFIKGMSMGIPLFFIDKPYLKDDNIINLTFIL